MTFYKKCFTTLRWLYKQNRKVPGSIPPGVITLQASSAELGRLKARELDGLYTSPRSAAAGRMALEPLGTDEGGKGETP